MSTPESAERDAPRPPWEEPGSFRLDCDPHRGFELYALAIGSVVCAGLSFCLCVPSLIGLPLSLAVWFVARQDLLLMYRGELDRRGEDLTDRAYTLSYIGLLLNSLFFLLLLGALCRLFL